MGFGFRVYGFGVLGLWVWGFESLGFGFRVYGFWVQGLWVLG